MSWNLGEQKYPQIATFWKVVKDHDSYAEVSLSTSTKTKSGEWENSGWGFCRFVGSAYRPELFELEPKDKIEIISGIVSRKSWVDKEGKRQYPKNEQVTIFAWRRHVRDNDGGGSQEENSGEESVEEDALPF